MMLKQQETSSRVQVQNEKKPQKKRSQPTQHLSRGIWSAAQIVRLKSATTQNKQRAGSEHSSFHLVSDSHSDHLTQYEGEIFCLFVCLFSVVQQFDSDFHTAKIHTLHTVLEGKDIYKPSSIIHFNIFQIMQECIILYNLPVCRSEEYTCFFIGQHKVFEISRKLH